MPYSSGNRGYRKGYRKRRYNRYRKKISPTKRLVTGQTQPTMLEKIASGVGTAAKLATSIIPIVKAINTEQKYIDVNTSSLLDSVTPVLITCALMATGTSENTRIGNSVLGKHINIRFTCSGNFTALDVNYVRIILFVDREGRGAVPTIGDLLSATTVTSAFNKNYTDRFSILKDKHITLSKNGMQGVQFKIFKPLDFHTRYIGTGATTADIGQNQIYMFMFSNTAAANPVGVLSNSRYSYTDN